MVYTIAKPISDPLGLVWTTEQVSVSVNASNDRQLAIFEHMMGFGPWVELDGKGGFSPKGNYGYLPFYYAHDPEFRAFVDGMTEPSGVNLVNSVRVDALLVAISTGRLEPELSALSGGDRAFLSDSAASRDFWSHAEQNLSPGQLVDLAIEVGTSSASKLARP